MFELIFGLFFVLLPIIVSIIITKTSGPSTFVGIICGILLIVGIVFIILGLIKIIKNFLTSKKGEECYGCVKEIKESGKYINNYPIYKAEFNVYVESTCEKIEIEEEIGTKPEKYPIGSYVKVKYYNKDINIIDKLDENLIPEEIKQKIKVEVTNETIEIDGIKYKRMF